MMISVCDRFENIVEKGENTDYQQYFYKPVQGHENPGLFLKELYLALTCVVKDQPFTGRQKCNFVQIERICRGQKFLKTLNLSFIG